MKKLICILLSAVMILGLAGCGAGGTNSGNEVVIVDPEPGNKTGNESDPKPSGGYRLSSLKLPVTVSYPDEESFFKNGNYDPEAAQKAWKEWNSQSEAKKLLAASYDGKLDHYLSLSAEYLKGMEGKNVLCSPINIYFALAMLAECCGGNSRTEILNVLGAADIEELRTVTKALWEQTYYASDSYTADLASSLWMNNDIYGTVPDFDKDTLATLALYYYATAYSGKATDKGFSAEFKDWLNDHTGGLLKEQVESLEDFTEDLVLAIASTVYFKASWANEFYKEGTADDIFHAASGDRNAPFMHITETFMMCSGDGFTAVFLPFMAAGGMWIILPDEGMSPEKLSADGVIMGIINDSEVYNASLMSGAVSEEILKFDYRNMRLSLPKFDVDAKLDLVEILDRMGIHDVFIEDAADLSGIVKNVQAYVSSVTHAARVKIDEEGCEAAAFTVIIAQNTSMPAEPIEFKVDRPFAFAITGSDGLPLFTGIVNEP